MRIGIVCKVIDNFGDAGFSLRLAKALTAQGHKVNLFHDQALAFKMLYPADEVSDLTLFDATDAEFKAEDHSELDMIVEPFGTSSEQTENRFDLALKQTCPNTPWLLIDYLSSEEWVENFHLSQSVDPINGRVTTYFYPGFTKKTGGLIHCDYPKRLKQQSNKKSEGPLRLFVFAYPNAPMTDLLRICNFQNTQNKNVHVSVAGNFPLEQYFDNVSSLPFCPQSEFDDLLSGYDVLFVRGEDSFVRAQLSGKPLIWQIYPTEDDVHTEKLIRFFERYSMGLDAACKSALWSCWASWNGLNNYPEFSTSWIELQPHWAVLRCHAIAWRDHLLNGPELVKEVLTWRSLQTPTLAEKPDL